jgi:hypothetical protein
MTLLALVVGMVFSASGKGLAEGEGPQRAVITWPTTRVTNTKSFNWMGDRQLRLDSTGKAHIAYGGDHLYYAYNNGAAWTYEIADNSDGVGLYASLALDSNNRPHISYYDAATGSLKYARKLGNTWETFALDTPNMASAFNFDDGENPSLEGLPVRPINFKAWADAQTGFTGLTESIQVAITMKGRGLFTSIAIDPYNEPHIAYYDATNGDLKYARKVYNGWQILPIDVSNDTGQYASIAVAKDASSKLFVHFSYYDVTAQDLRYVKLSAESSLVLKRDSVDTGGDVGKFSSIALTNENDPQPRISYYSSVDSKNTYLKYADYKSDKWASENVTEANQLNGQFTSLALDKNNSPHISYLSVSSGKLKLAVPSSSGWSKTEIASVDPNGNVFSSIVVDKNVTDGNIDARVSFYNAGTASLQFATQTASGWSVGNVDNAADLGAFNSLAFDGAGNPHITFFDDTHDSLMYVKWNGTVWEGPSVVDQNSGAGLYNDIAISSDGKIHIAYYNAGTTCLRYATGTIGQWVAENVETPNSNGICAKVGKYASIAVDKLNRPHIAYYDETNGNLKWAYKDGGIWKIAYVDQSTEDVGLYTSIAIDSANQPRISYFDATAKNLKYAALQGASWKVEDHVNPQNTQGGQYSQLSLDSQGYPHIAYMDDSNEDTLRYTWKTDLNNTFWNYEAVQAGVNISGNYDAPVTPLSIAVGQDGTVHISFFDFAAKSLRYARKTAGVWSYSMVDASGNNGQYSSIAINAAGTVGVSYYDALNGDLKYTYAKLVDLPYSIFLPVVNK